MRNHCILIALSALLVLPVATAAEPKVETVCKSAAVTDDIRKKYLGEMLKLNPVVVPTDFLEAGTAIQPTDLILKCAKNCDNADKIKDNIFSKFLHANGRDYRIKWKGSGVEPALDFTAPDDALNTALEKRLRSFLDLSQRNYEMTCTASAVERAARTAAKEKRKCDPKKGKVCLSPRNLSMMKSTDSLEKDFKKRDEATMAFSIDKVDQIETEQEDGSSIKEDKQVLNANIAIVYEDLFNSKYRSDFTPKFSPFIQLEYQSNRDPEEETDNLSFGASLHGQVPNLFEVKGLPDEIGLGLDTYRLTGSWITDIEERESSQWFTALNLPLVSLDYEFSNDLNRLRFGWYLIGEGVLDYSRIGEVGDKKALEKLSSYTRYGYDLRFVSRLGYGFSSWSVALDAKYKFRDDFTSGPANADLWEVGLKFKPSDASNFSYGVTYKRGENITTLEGVENWEFNIGFKM